MRQLHWSNTPVQRKKKRHQSMNSQSKRRGSKVCWISCPRLTKSMQETTTLVLVVDRTNASRQPSAAPRSRADSSSCGRAVCNVHLRATRLAPQRRPLQVGRGRADPRQGPCTLSPHYWGTGTSQCQGRPTRAAHLSITSLILAGASTRRI